MKRLTTKDFLTIEESNLHLLQTATKQQPI